MVRTVHVTTATGSSYAGGRRFRSHRHSAATCGYELSHSIGVMIRGTHRAAKSNALCGPSGYGSRSFEDPKWNIKYSATALLVSYTLPE